MKDKTARNIAITVALACVIIMVVMLSNVWGADFKPPARWGEGIDSAKWFITLADGTHYDSTAGVARTNIASYDTTFTGLSNDTGYILNLSMWDGSDSASSWVFYWPVLRWDTRIDSIVAALADANIGDKVWTDPGTRTITGGALTTPADYKADVSALALQTEVVNIDGWNPATDQVTADMTSISGDADAADSLEEACDGYDDAGLSLFERIVALLDSLDNHDNWVAQQAVLNGLSKYFGACDGCYQILYPRSGTVNKDSVIIIDPSLGNDSLVGKIIFYHGTTPSVYDSSYYYIDEPW